MLWKPTHANDAMGSVQVNTPRGPRWYRPKVSYENYGKQCNVYDRFEKEIKTTGTKPLMLLIGSGGDIGRGQAKLKKPGVTGGSELSVDTDIAYFRGFNKRTSFVDIYGEWKVKGGIRKTEHVKELITDMLQKSRNHYIIYYTGHGDKDGDWCFTDGWITFEWLYDMWMKLVPDGRRLTVISDCCNSGVWIDKLKEKRMNPGVYLLFTAAGKCQSAYDNRLSTFLWKRDWYAQDLETKPQQCLNINHHGSKMFIKSELAKNRWQKESQYVAFRPWKEEDYTTGRCKACDAAFGYNYVSLCENA